MAKTANDVGLQGWDLVNAALSNVVNEGIAKQKTVPPGFAATDPTSGASLTGGVWKSWKMQAGSSGGTLRMALKVGAGTASYPVAAGWTTLDPATSSRRIIIGAAGLSVSRPSSAIGRVSAFGDVGRQTGKAYFEITNDEVAATRDRMGVGLAQASASNTAFTDSADTYAYFTGGDAWRDGASAGGFPAPGGGRAPGDTWSDKGETVGVAVDFDAGKIWFRGPSGAWQGAGADPMAGTGEAFAIDTSAPLFAAVELGPKGAAVLNFGETAFVHPLPDGYRTTDAVDLAGATVTADITLAQVPGPGGRTVLRPDPKGTPNSRAVVVRSAILQDETPADPPVTTLFDKMLNDDIGDFTNVFQTVDLADKIDDSDAFDWIKPKTFAYAAADVPGTSPAETVFAVLNNTTAMQTPGTLAEQVDPSIVADLPAGANAVLAISAERITEHILLPVAKSLVKGGGKDGDFEIAGDGRIVQNTKELAWFDLGAGPIDKTTGQAAYTLKPKIPAGGLTVEIDGDRIRVAFTGLTYSMPAAFGIGSVDVSIGFSQSMWLTLAPKDPAGGTGGHVLVPTFKDPNDDASEDIPRSDGFQIAAQLSQGAETFEWAMAIIGTALSLCTVGLIAWTARGCTIAAGSAEEAEAQNAANDAAGAGNGAVDAVYGELPAAWRQAMGMEMEDLAAQAAVDDNYWAPPPPGAAADVVPAGAVGCLPRQAVLRGTLAAVAGLGAGASFAAFGIHKHAADIAKGDFSALDGAVTLEAFAETVLAQFDWPETRGWELQDVRLDGALLLFGKIEI